MKKKRLWLILAIGSLTMALSGSGLEVRTGLLNVAGDLSLAGAFAYKTLGVDDLYSESKWVLIFILVQFQVRKPVWIASVY